MNKFDLLSDTLSFEGIKIMVVGDVMLDRYLWGEVKRISPEAPVPVFHIKKRSVVPGGSGNVVLNLIGLGASVTLISIIGKDENAHKLKKLFGDQKIKSILLRDQSRPTIIKTRIISKGQQLLRVDDENDIVLNESIKRKIIEQVRREIRKCDAVILSDYGKGIFQTQNVTEAIIEISKDHDVPIIVDPKGKNWERYAGATCITPNTDELELLFGETIKDDKDLVGGMNTILSEYMLSNLLVTRGPLGMCLLSNDGTPQFISSIAKEVYDVSGAGDTVIATLTAGIASGMSYFDAAQLANIAAGVVVGKLGTQPIKILELKAATKVNGEQCRGGVNYKIHSLAAAALQVQAWKANDEKIVFTNGCFDLLHPAHIYLLNEAKACGSRLIVGLNSDASVRRLKGEDRPILNEKDRAAIIGALNCVDIVIIFNEDTPLELIKSLQPDMLVKGADYRSESVVGGEIVASYGGNVVLVPILEGYSTTNLTSKLMQIRNNGKTPKPIEQREPLSCDISNMVFGN